MNKEKRFTAARSALLAWHATYGRHDLPWRENATPYGVLVSEFMLQQTTVATVRPRFLEWMRLFPTLADLSEASEEAVLTAWQGLGYYSRARRLHAAAKKILTHYEGEIPSDAKALHALPGIGDYTAAAIRAFAYNAHSIVLDTNIIRVLARWAHLITPIDSAIGKKTLQQIAISFYPATHCRAIATALMDLGATLCRSGEPDCALCPLQQSCQAVHPTALPRKSLRTATTKHSECRAWIHQNTRLYLELSQGPRWRGLWILPELEGYQPTSRPLSEITYPITRYRVTMKVYRTTSPPLEHLRGFTREELSSIPIPSPHRRAIEKSLKAIGKASISVHTPRDVQYDS